jgi:hypothetical protein
MKRKRTEDERKAQQLISDGDSDAHISEDEISPHASNNEKDDDDRTETDNILQTVGLTICDLDCMAL